MTPAEVEADSRFYDDFVGVELIVPCSTWDPERAVELFGPDFKHKTTSATIVKVKRGRKIGEPMFDIMFCELKRQIYTNYNLDYILNYTDEVP